MKKNWEKIADNIIRKVSKRNPQDEFSDDVKQEAFTRAEEKCEKCRRQLCWEHNDRDHEDSWEAHHIISPEDGGSDELDNCQILCWPCHGKTFLGK